VSEIPFFEKMVFLLLKKTGKRKLTGSVRALLTIFKNATEYAINALHGYQY